MFSCRLNGRIFISKCPGEVLVFENSKQELVIKGSVRQISTLGAFYLNTWYNECKALYAVSYINHIAVVSWTLPVRVFL